jgi:DNA-binding transcriptional ArsR family regulator
VQRRARVVCLHVDELEPQRRGEILEQELAEPFGLTLNGVKKHVRVLEDAELVITEKVGRARECRLGPAQLQDAARWIEEYRRAWEGRLDRFGAYVEHSTAKRR